MLFYNCEVLFVKCFLGVFGGFFGRDLIPTYGGQPLSTLSGIYYAPKTMAGFQCNLQMKTKEQKSKMLKMEFRDNHFRRVVKIKGE